MTPLPGDPTLPPGVTDADIEGPRERDDECEQDRINRDFCRWQDEQLFPRNEN